MGLVDGSGNIATAVTYDEGKNQRSVTFGNPAQGGTTLANVAAGLNDGDAVNVAQYKSLADAIGGGAVVGASGLVSTPQFNIMGINYGNVGDAFGAVNVALGSLDSRVGNLEANAGSGGTGGPALGTGDGLAIGGGSHAQDKTDVAVGSGSTVHAGNSTSLGNNTSVAASADNAVAVGADSSVTGASGTAIGQGSSVTASNAVAIGAGSVADQDSTVSVGNANQQRRITQVADGVAATDAATVGQVTAFTQNAITAAQNYADAGDAQTLNSANAYTDQKTANLVTNDNFNAFRDSVNNQFHAVNTRLNRVGAMGSAMAGMAGAIAAAPGTDNRVSAAAGTYGGQGALAVGFARRIPGNGAVLIGGSIAGGGESSGTVGVSFGW